MNMSVTQASKSFASLLRNSNIVKLGDYRNKEVIGTIFHTHQNDLYVDLGLKFHAVVRRPQRGAQLYCRGATVRLKLIDYELTDRFIGKDHDTTMLEADAILLGLDKSPKFKSRASVLERPPEPEAIEERLDEPVEEESSNIEEKRNVELRFETAKDPDNSKTCNKPVDWQSLIKDVFK